MYASVAASLGLSCLERGGGTGGGVKGDGWESEVVGGGFFWDDEEKGRRENVMRMRGWELRRRRCAKRGGGCGFRVL